MTTAKEHKELFEKWANSEDSDLSPPPTPELRASVAPIVMWVGGDATLRANDGGDAVQLDPTATIRWLRATFPDEFAAVAGEVQG